MKWFDEDNWFDIEKVDVNDADKLKSVCEWFNNRLDDIHDGERTIYFGNGYVSVEYSWEDYCRGCYMGTEYERIEVPNDILFSNYSLSQWMEEENERKQKREAEEKKQKAAAEKRRKTIEARRKAAEKEKHDREEYERLKEKFKEDK